VTYERTKDIKKAKHQDTDINSLTLGGERILFISTLPQATPLTSPPHTHMSCHTERPKDHEQLETYRLITECGRKDNSILSNSVTPSQTAPTFDKHLSPSGPPASAMSSIVLVATVLTA
jgi:hypothetical protein